MKPQEYDILELIPHRPPMTMIDELNEADERSARGRLFIRESNLFVSNGFFCEPGIIEFIAQTAAAFTSYKNKMLSGAVTEGYIGAIKNLVITALPPVNEEIQSEIVIENEIVGFTLITGRVFYKSQVIAACEMRILVK